MHTIDDREHKILIRHPDNWIGTATIYWEATVRASYTAKATVQALSCEVDGRYLLTGLFTPTRTGDPEPPVNVITRAVALAVYEHVTATMVRAAEQCDGVWRRK